MRNKLLFIFLNIVSCYIALHCEHYLWGGNDMTIKNTIIIDQHNKSRNLRILGNTSMINSSICASQYYIAGCLLNMTNTTIGSSYTSYISGSKIYVNNNAYFVNIYFQLTNNKIIIDKNTVLNMLFNTCEFYNSDIHFILPNSQLYLSQPPSGFEARQMYIIFDSINLYVHLELDKIAPTKIILANINNITVDGNIKVHLIPPILKYQLIINKTNILLNLYI